MKSLHLGSAAIAATLAISLTACGSSTDPEAADLPTLEPVSNDASESSAPEAPQGDAASPSGDDGEVDAEEAMAQYEACMADLGFAIQTVDGGVSGADLESTEISQPPTGVNIEDFSIEALQEAEAECGSILDEAFGEFDLSPEQEAEMADGMLAMQLCLADEGFEIDLQGNGFELPQDVDFEEFEAAMQTCQPTDGIFADPSGE